jgi:hypothetical protein
LQNAARAYPLLLIFALFGFSGCSTFSWGDLEADGAQASAFCTKGGPGGTSGLGPGGVVVRAKVNPGFIGYLYITERCEIKIIALHSAQGERDLGGTRYQIKPRADRSEIRLP